MKDKHSKKRVVGKGLTQEGREEEGGRKIRGKRGKGTYTNEGNSKAERKRGWREKEKREILGEKKEGEGEKTQREREKEEREREVLEERKTWRKRGKKRDLGGGKWREGRRKEKRGERKKELSQHLLFIFHLFIHSFLFFFSSQVNRYHVFLIRDFFVR